VGWGARFLGVLVLGAIAVGGPRHAHGQAPPDLHLEWRTIETEHFVVHYHVPLGVAARRVAAIGERAHRTLSRILGHFPDERTHVVLSDLTDFANGSANAIPYNNIRLNASGPDDLSTLEDHDDWLAELVIHEHTHVLHLDTIGGLPAIINTILGKVYPPNAVQPRWFIEGLAVHHESGQTSGGRLRSSQFEMYLRMDALEDRLLALDDISNQPVRWPHGNIPYLYGSRFVHFIAERYGERAIRQITHDYGSQLVPYALNRVCQRATGKTFVELYEEWRAALRTESEAIRTRVEREGRIAGTRLTHHGQEAAYPRYLSEDRIAYSVSDGRTITAIRSLDARSGRDADLMTRSVGRAHLSPHPDGRHIYFTNTAPFRDWYGFHDVFVHDVAEDSVERLTEGLRAEAVDVSPNGRQLAFTLNGAGTRHLAVAEIDDIQGTRRVLVRSHRFEQVYTPRWSPDGRRIAFSAWYRGGRRDIAVVDVETGTVTHITDDRALDTGPAWSPDGGTLYFSSDRTGIANIYAHELATGEIAQVTHVVGGAYQPDVSPSGRHMVYVGYTSHGFDLFTLPLDPSTYRPAPPYSDSRPPAIAETELLALHSKAYEPLETLWPRAYGVSLSDDGFGPQVLVSVEAEDAVGYYRYAGSLGVGTVRGNVNATLSFSLQRAPLPIGLRAFHVTGPRDGLAVEGESRRWVAAETGGSVGVSYPLPARLHSESLALDYSLSYLAKAAPFGGRIDPNDPPPTFPNTGWRGELGARWQWSDVTRTTYDISASGGRTLWFGVRLIHPLLGAQFEALSTNWGIAQYLEMPWLRHHVLALRYAGGLSTSRVFGVGGYPVQDYIQAVLDFAFLGGVALRGYPPGVRVGRQLHLVQSEYRFPIVDPDVGLGLFPAYLSRIWGAVFFDAGNAFDDAFDVTNFAFGVGAELYLRFIIAYRQAIDIRVGIARGLSEGGETQAYLHLGSPF
jgi:hypothetical protein